MIRRILAVLMLAGMLITFAGCNTMEGVGEDVESGGEAVEDAADGDDMY